MKRLPQAKRNQLIGVIAATLGLICLVYFLLIRPQNAKIDGLAVNIGKENARLAQIKTTILMMGETTTNLADLTQQLGHAEEDIASGDLYAWTVDKIRTFKTTYPKVEIPTPNQPSQGDCDLLGEFPYKQIRVTLNGTAYYHDLGKFVSDFENKFVHCRVVNLSADPVSQTPASSDQRLNFKMDIIALVKPTN